MAPFILFALIGIPLLEIAVFIRVGSDIGLGSTLAATALTAVIGTVLMRTQGLSTLVKARDGLNGGVMPVRAVFDGACQVVAGILLLTPGFVTDFVGLVLFFPPFRSVLLRWISGRSGITVIVSGHREPKPNARHTYDMDGDYTDITPTEGAKLEDQKKPDGR